MRKVKITRVLIPQTPGFSAPRWFVEIERTDGTGWDDDSNYDSEDDARQRQNELRTMQSCDCCAPYGKPGFILNAYQWLHCPQCNQRGVSNSFPIEL